MSILSLSRRALLGFVASAGIVVGLPAAAQERVVFGTPGAISDNSLAVQVAIDEGFYEEAGLAVEVVNFKGGAPSIQALVGGGIDYAIAAPEHVTRLRQRGVEAIVAFALQGTHTYALLAPASSDVQTFEDLKGKRIGITSSGSLTENLIRLEALDAGLAFGQDFEVVGAGVGVAQKAALDTQRIDAGMFGNIDALQLVRDGYRVVHDWRQERVPGLALLALSDTAAERPAVHEAVIRATLKAQQLVISDPELTLAKLKQLYPTYSEDILQQVASGLANSLEADGVFAQEPYDKLQDDLVLIEPDIEKVDYQVANPGTFLR